MKWRWEMTPLEIFQVKVVKPTPGGDGFLSMEVSPFKLPRLPLEGANGLTHQFGLSDCSLSEEVKLWKATHPEIPVTGDRRSGIIVFDGDEIVASYIFEGRRTGIPLTMVVRKDYRGSKPKSPKPLPLSVILPLEFFKRVKRQARPEPQQTEIVQGARAYIRTLTALYEWAVRTGKSIPEKVQREIETKEETNYILGLLSEVERTGTSVTIGI
jgi:hypothetical protein